MAKHITVARSWQELNKWQLEEIVDLYLHHDSENFSSSFNRMILILFQKKKNFWNSLKLESSI
ncbi:hypothetical protein GNY06_00145 [Elizabethkingia argentiflava]|uniref:Uncharacterized protein n=1 Tax=Elizabethkingia argenteiflava TaxID=2681556 RepID=A0A845PNE0_9FLAO|nr:hypothetical protein [Elizabethkingia argenteiflava]NAW49879.1 hypothetical protein [Elizabethkingia argenteiflava]